MNYFYALKGLLGKWFVVCKCSWNSCWWKGTFPYQRLLEYNRALLCRLVLIFAVLYEMMKHFFLEDLFFITQTDNANVLS